MSEKAFNQHIKETAPSVVFSHRDAGQFSAIEAIIERTCSMKRSTNITEPQIEKAETDRRKSVINAVGKDAEYRIRQIVQSAVKFQRHSKRKLLTTDDVNNSISLLGIDPLFGFNYTRTDDESRIFQKYTNDSLNQSKSQPIFYLEDPEIDLQKLINEDGVLPKVPLQPTVMMHWLAINGRQPTIKENPSSEEIEEKKKRKITGSELDKVEHKLPVKHLLSKEMQLYYETATNSVFVGDEKSRSIVFHSLSSDTGLHQLIPYFCKFIAQTVPEKIIQKPKPDDLLEILFSLMRIVRCLLNNPHVDLELYIHQLVGPVTSCMVSKNLSSDPLDNHWQMRDYCARILFTVCKKYGNEYIGILPRLVLSLQEKIDVNIKYLAQQYGVIVGLTTIGFAQINVLPFLSQYMTNLYKLLTSDNPIKRLEARKLYGALMNAVAISLSSKQIGRITNTLPPPPSISPPHAIIKEGERVKIQFKIIVTKKSIVQKESEKRSERIERQYHGVPDELLMFRLLSHHRSNKKHLYSCAEYTSCRI